MSAEPVRYIRDRDTVRVHQRGYPLVVACFASNAPEVIATTIVTVEAQFQGRLARVRHQHEPTALIAAHARLRATRACCCAFPVLLFTCTWMNPATAQYRALVSRRIRTGTNDLRIAAIAPPTGEPRDQQPARLRADRGATARGVAA